MKLGLHAGSDTSISQYTAFGTWLGQTVLTRNVFADNTTWSGISSPYMLATTKTWLAQGAQFQEVITIGLCPTPSVSTSNVHLSAVAAGTYDSNFTTLGQKLVNLGTNPATNAPYMNQIVIRLGHEFNGNWYQWGIGTGSGNPGGWNSPTDYANAFSHVVGVLRAAGATGLKFEWNLSLGGNGLNSAGLAAAYPGDSVVDIISIDVYDNFNNGWANIVNGGSSVMTGGLNGFRSFAKSRNKPEAYTEWGCDITSNGHQDNPFFIEAMFQFINSGNVDHHCYWNTSSGGPNAAIQGSSVAQIVASISGTTMSVTTTNNGLPAVNQWLSTNDPLNNTPVLSGTKITAKNTATVTASISSTTLTITSGSGIAIGMVLTGTGVSAGTIVMSGSGNSWTVNKSQTVGSTSITGTSYTVNNSQTRSSQTIDSVSVPQSAQLFKTLFGKSKGLTTIAAKLSSGVIVPSSAVPTKNLAVMLDGSNYYVM